MNQAGTAMLSTIKLKVLNICTSARPVYYAVKNSVVIAIARAILVRKQPIICTATKCIMIMFPTNQIFG